MDSYIVVDRERVFRARDHHPRSAVNKAIIRVGRLTRSLGDHRARSDFCLQDGILTTLLHSHSLVAQDLLLGSGLRASMLVTPEHGVDDEL